MESSLMLRRLTLVALLAGSSCTLAGRSLAQAPTTAPSTAPAVVESMTTMPTSEPASQPVVIDPASPKGALVKLSAALDGGDAEALNGVLIATTPLEQKI